jgi:hypothetical protein
LVSKARRCIFEFLNQKLITNILLVRESELKKEAKKKNIGPTTLHKELTSLVESKELIRVPKTIRGHYAVFYGWNSRFRDWWITELKEFATRCKVVRELDEKLKPLALKEMIDLVIGKTMDFVPFTIWHILENWEKITDHRIVLEDFCDYILYQYMDIAIYTCLENWQQASKLEIIKAIQQGYKEYLKSDAYRKLRERLNAG